MGRDAVSSAPAVTTVYFNPRAPYGARPWGSFLDFSFFYFNPRAPYGARHAVILFLRVVVRFQSTRPVWGATAVAVPQYVDTVISIHAPRMGRDRSASMTTPPPRHFNPRAPYGARRFWPCPGWSIAPFQSTRPVWGATHFSTSSIM